MKVHKMLYMHTVGNDIYYFPIFLAQLGLSHLDWLLDMTKRRFLVSFLTVWSASALNSYADLHPVKLIVSSMPSSAYISSRTPI